MAIKTARQEDSSPMSESTLSKPTLEQVQRGEITLLEFVRNLDLDALDYIPYDDEGAKNIPDSPGIYIFKTPEGWDYVGQSTSLKRRLRYHPIYINFLANEDWAFVGLAYLEVPKGWRMLLDDLEFLLIHVLKPRLNGIRDGLNTAIRKKRLGLVEVCDKCGQEIS